MRATMMGVTMTTKIDAPADDVRCRGTLGTDPKRVPKKRLVGA